MEQNITPVHVIIRGVFNGVAVDLNFASSSQIRAKNCNCCGKQNPKQVASDTKAKWQQYDWIKKNRSFPKGYLPQMKTLITFAIVLVGNINVFKGIISLFAFLSFVDVSAAGGFRQVYLQYYSRKFEYDLYRLQTRFLMRDSVEFNYRSTGLPCSEPPPPPPLSISPPRPCYRNVNEILEDFTSLSHFYRIAMGFQQNPVNSCKIPLTFL